MTSAQQLICKRTTADMQAHNSCCAVHDSIFRNDRYYIFQQLILYLPTTYPISSNNLCRFFQHPYPYLSTTLSTFENERRHIYIVHQRLENGKHVYRKDEGTYIYRHTKRTEIVPANTSTDDHEHGDARPKRRVWMTKTMGTDDREYGYLCPTTLGMNAQGVGQSWVKRCVTFPLYQQTLLYFSSPFLSLWTRKVDALYYFMLK